MASNGVDVRTPIFYRQSFAGVLETQSSKVYFRLTHTPLIAEHLPRGAASGARIEQFAAAHLHTLDDLERVLRAVLEETATEQSYASLFHPAASAVLPRHGLAGDGLHGAATVAPSPSAALQRGTAAAVPLPSSSPDRLPRTVSFSTEPSHTEAAPVPDTEKSGASVPGAPSKSPFTASATTASAAAAVHTVRDACARVWQGLCGVVTSPWRNAADSSSASTAQSTRTAPAPSHVTLNSSIGVTGVTRVPVRTARSGVPPWVKAAFAPATIALVPQPVSSMRSSSSAAPSQLWLRAPAPPVPAVPASKASAPPAGAAAALGGGLGGAAGAAPRDASALVGQEASVHIIHPAELLRATTAYESSYRAAPGEARTDADADDEDAASSHMTQTPHSRSYGPSPVGRGPSDMPESDQLDLSAPGSGARSTVPRHDEAGERRPSGGVAVEDGSPPPSASVTTRTVSVTAAPTASADSTSEMGMRAAPRPGHSGSGSSAGEGPLPLSRGRLERPRNGDSGGRAHGTVADLSSAGPSLSFSHTWYGLEGGGEANAGAAQSLPIPTSTPTLLLPRGGASAIGSWDRHAYGTELVGWLHLLVWVRWQVIYFLRDLSGVQGYVAWSAWYWSWAQEHPHQAAFHQALSSTGFWRGLWRRGLHAQLTQVQYEISRHMFTLKSVFQLIVSYIGAAYTALEQLNTLVTQVQRRCEVMMSPVAAAAAAAAVARTSGGAAGGATGTAAGSSSLAASPAHNAHGSPHRGGAAANGYELFSNQNSIFWSPLVNGSTDVSEAASPLEGSPRDGPGSPYGLAQSVFAGAVPPRAGPHDDVDRESAVTALEEGVEAASSLHAMDELRRAVWSMLQELKVMFCPDGLRLDALEGAEQARFPLGGGAGVALDASMVAGHDGHGALPRPNDNILFGASVLGDAAAATAAAMAAAAAAAAGHHSGVQVHFTDSVGPCTHDGSDTDGSRQPTVRDGAQTLLLCAQRSQLLLRRLTTLVQRLHCPPASRHWRRMLVATATVVPPFLWLYTKSPAELTAVARQAMKLGHQMARTYVLEPVAQLRESLFYVRPGVEDRRGAFDRDATSLANIIRDFHEDMYPDMPQVRLEELRARTLERLRAGVADPDGFGLIDEQYRHSVRHPIRSVILGNLPRIMLIQLSYQALEVSRVANGIDEVLEGNDINFKIMAMMPVFLAGGLLVAWSLFRFRVFYQPVRLRMKLLWRSLFRVVSFAGGGQSVVLPFLRLNVQQGGPQRTAAVATVTDFPRATPNLAGKVSRLRKKADEGQHQHQRNRKAAAAAGRSPPRHDGSANSRDADDADTAAFSESRSDPDRDSASNDGMESATTTTSIGAAASARQLNNYEQGMVLLLSHVMRSIASEYLGSYAFFHELMEDLNDLESVQSTRHQRLATLERMRATHTILF